jgi:transcription antitermination factor NusG
VPGVLNVVSNGKIPVPIDEVEIESLRVLVDSKLPIGPHPYLKAGDRVAISNGPLAGATGYIMQTDQKRLIVSITLLQRSVAVAVCADWLDKLPAESAADGRLRPLEAAGRLGPYFAGGSPVRQGAN